jgi:hypothetical protein
MKCISDNKCNNIAEYNYEYYSNPAYCSKHKTKQMVRKTEMSCIIL